MVVLLERSFSSFLFSYLFASLINSHGSVPFDHVKIDHDDINHVDIDHVNIDCVAIDHGPD